MASDRRQFERCYSHWKDLYRKDKFSIADSVGVTAILASDYPFNTVKVGTEGMFDDVLDHIEFRNEAYEIADYLGNLSIPSEVITGATGEDLSEAIQDREVSSIVVIGHGSISDIFLDGTACGRYDWRDVSRATTHLKTGTFTQRQCGIFRRRLNIPLGFFAMSDFSNVRAAVGEVFDPKSEDSPNKVGIHPVVGSYADISYDSLLESFRDE